MRRALATGFLLTAATLLAAGCGGAPSSTEGGSPAATDAGCSRDAILTAVKAGASGQDVKELSQFKCSGDWAYAGVVTSGPEGIEYTAVLQRDGDGWKAVDREGPCKDHSVPADIYQAACETN
jgi:hypothetical protein